MFCLDNLSTHTVKEKEPWNIDPAKEFNYPAGGFKTADAYRKWTTQQTTRYCAFSLVEGEVKAQRITTDNEPVKIHGLVADYDPAGGFSDKEVQDFISRTLASDHPCAYISRSYNGGLHVIWFFEEPVSVRGMKQAKSFLARCAKELKLSKLARGMDSTVTSPERYYRYGSDWKTVAQHVIPTPILWAWLHGSTRKDHFKEYGDPIPLEDVAKEFETRWPGEWPGEFKEGVRGPTVFDPHGGHTSTDSAIIRENGMQTFNMEKGFYSWAEILGHQFVHKYLQMQIGKVIQNFWYDGQGYWELVDGKFHNRKKDDVSLRLRVAYGLNNRAQKGTKYSEVDEALSSIMTNKVVDAAVPFVYNKDEIVSFNGGSYLNLSQVRVATPDPNPQQWGQNFPFIASVIDGVYGSVQGEYFKAWLSRFYQGAYVGKPEAGHAVFTVGGPGVGKSFIFTAIVSELMGGHTPAGKFLMGETAYNASKFAKGLWTIDDNVPAATAAKYRHYTSTVKSLVANAVFESEEKFQKAGEVEWTGRLCVTANYTQEDIRMIPELDISIRDKVMVFKANQHKVKFHDKFTNMDLVRKEIPFFAKWLLDYQVPAKIKGTSRFGVQYYIHPNLEDFLLDNSPHAYVVEIIDIFRNHFFSAGNGPTVWKGTTSEFLKEVGSYPGANHFLKGIDALRLGRSLGHYLTKGVPWLSRNSKVWIIKDSQSSTASQPQT